MNINTVHMTGNLTDDPELRYTPSGKPVVSASIANNEHYTDAQGEEKKVTTFVNLQIWGKPAEISGTSLRRARKSSSMASCAWTNGRTSKPTLAAPVFICWSKTGNSPSTGARRRALPRLPLPPLPPLQWPSTRKRPGREPSNSVTGTGGLSNTARNHANHSPRPFQNQNE